MASSAPRRRAAPEIRCLPGGCPVQDIAALTLAWDLRDLLLAQRSGGYSPRLPGVALVLSGSGVPPFELDLRLVSARRVHKRADAGAASVCKRPPMLGRHRLAGRASGSFHPGCLLTCKRSSDSIPRIVALFATWTEAVNTARSRRPGGTAMAPTTRSRSRSWPLPPRSPPSPAHRLHIPPGRHAALEGMRHGCL
jgi:hypothetical protein